MVPIAYRDSKLERMNSFICLGCNISFIFENNIEISFHNLCNNDINISRWRNV
jgi:hypothetical protein